MKRILFLSCLLPVLLVAQVGSYTAGTVFLRDGSELTGKLKIDKFATKILFKDSVTGEKLKLSARELDRAKVNAKGIIATLSFKILNGKGKGPKIVQHIAEGAVSLYKKLDQDHDYYKPTPPKKGFFDFNAPFDPLTQNQSAVNPSGAMAGGMVGFAVLYSLIVKSEKIWFYGTTDADVVDILPKKRKEIMKLFNDCPQAMVKFRDVDEKAFDFVYFLRYYNVECACN